MLDSVDVDLAALIAMLSLPDMFFFLAILVGPVVLERDELVELLVIKKKDFVLCETKVLLRDAVVLEASLNLASSDQILEVKFVVVVKQRL